MWDPGGGTGLDRTCRCFLLLRAGVMTPVPSRCVRSGPALLPLPRGLCQKAPRPRVWSKDRVTRQEGCCCLWASGPRIPSSYFLRVWAWPLPGSSESLGSPQWLCSERAGHAGGVEWNSGLPGSEDVSSSLPRVGAAVCGLCSQGVQKGTSACPWARLCGLLSSRHGRARGDPRATSARAHLLAAAWVVGTGSVTFDQTDVGSIPRVSLGLISICDMVATQVGLFIVRHCVE